MPLLGSSRSSYFLFGWRGHGGNLFSALRQEEFRRTRLPRDSRPIRWKYWRPILAGARRWRERICPKVKWQMANTMLSLVGTLEVVWHIVGRGLAVVLGTLWAWELVASRKRAKALQNLQEVQDLQAWPSKRPTSNLSRPGASSMAPEPAAKTNSDILSRITRPAVHRQRS